MVTMGSLFSGIGLLDYGVEIAFRDAGIPIEPKFQVEINPFCRAVLERHWPEVPKYEDVTRVGSTGASLPAVDLLVGGFPCQDVSTAGKGLGLLRGKRSGLWFEYLRIIKETKPSAVIVENVPGLIRRGLDDVVSGLTGAGYEVEATRIEAADVGGSHRRQRVFILAYAKGMLGNGIEHNSASGHSRNRHPKNEIHESGDNASNRGEGSSWETCFTSMGRAVDGRGCWLDGRLAPGLPGTERKEGEPDRLVYAGANKVLRLKSLGNAVVPQCAYVAAMRVIERLALKQLNQEAA